MAGTDATLLSLSGAGYADSRSFGFASCPRVVGAAEGMNVLLERKVRQDDGRVEHAYNVTNVEYTEFEKQGICDVPAAPGSQYSCFPANTNVLYVGLKVRPSRAIRPAPSHPNQCVLNMPRNMLMHQAQGSCSARSMLGSGQLMYTLMCCVWRLWCCAGSRAGSEGRGGGWWGRSPSWHDPQHIKDDHLH